MKIILLLLSTFSLGEVSLASPIEQLNNTRSLCESGPIYWCKNFENSRSCHATTHCIQTVWQHLSVPQDKGSICEICLNMVKEARDQLRSNQTQDDLRAVFEGSCKLMHVMVAQCTKLVDSFIPELIEALSSQMNPQVVCSVAGLCNTANVEQKIDLTQVSETRISCETCKTMSSDMINTFQRTEKVNILDTLLQFCGKMSSFSDACTSIILTHFNEIHQYVEKNLNAHAVCHLSGICDEKYHQHTEKNIKIIPMSNIGFVKSSDPDIPCELCEQLVNHLRDLLIANTTKSEFKQVLVGLCGQTKSFKNECLAIVSQYYAEMYDYLTKNLNPNDVCFYVGVCPKGLKSIRKNDVIVPIVPQDLQIPLEYGNKNKLSLKFNDPILHEDEMEKVQLPFDQLMGASHITLIEEGAWCTMCEYILHFVQEELSDAKNEEQIKKTIMNTCNKMPESVAPECRNFVELYGDAVIALIIQEVDPSAICPQLKLCPQNLEKETEIFAPKSIKIYTHSDASNKASCPLCLLAVEQAQQVIQTNKTIDRIEETLEHLCSHLNNKLKMECNDFVQTYSRELVNLLMKNFTPQEICVYLKLCTDQYGYGSKLNEEQVSNGILDNTINGIVIEKHSTVESTPQCLLCQEMVKEVEKNLIDKNSKADIKMALQKACAKVPKKARSKCNEYIEKHGDQIAELIMEQLSPKEICRDIQLCSQHSTFSGFNNVHLESSIEVTLFADLPLPVQDGSPTKKSSQTCIICEIVIAQLDKDLEKPKTQEQVKKYLDGVCNILPTIKNECKTFINTYSTLILQAFESIPPKKICGEINACLSSDIKNKDEIVECAVCEGSIASFKTLLKEDNVDSKMEDLLKKSCQTLPARFYEKCQQMIEFYGISITEQIKYNPESHNVCVEIAMCYRDQTAGFVNINDFLKPNDDEIKIVTEKQPLLGLHECTYGPSYWCKDEQTARKCNSFDFCKRNQIGMWAA